MADDSTLPLARRGEDPPALPMDAQGRDLHHIRVVLTFIAILAAGAATYFARTLLLPIVLAVLITLTLRPAARAAMRLGIPSTLAGPALILALGSGVGVAIYAASGPLGQLVEEAPRIGQELRWKLRELTASVAQMQEMAQDVQDMAQGDQGGPSQPQEVVVEGPGFLGTMVSSLAGAGTSLALAFVLAIFMLGAGDTLEARIAAALPSRSDKMRARRIISDVEHKVSRYLAAITVINAGLGASVGLSLWALGMPYPLVWGIAAFLLNFLPYLGAILGIAAVAAVALVTFDTAGQALLCPLAYFVLTSIEGQFVTPMALGRQLALNTLVVLLTVTIWVWLWGVAGAFLAVPILVFLKVITDHVPSMNRLGLLLESRGAEQHGAA
ncbi:AI-2E family transporter [Roseibacterium beibuensis]|uniref:AI-2E family transporter n=1 Tax=[Roseibacterium] beibuensis TaxID=1193142 RepID=A0ABP9LER4_9RHOB|nr:AI-2E family transporter [Roseibacterium beibuensis]MCS6623610.1 AI-2E family transporter [Roseibacterium beibuensis]